MTVPALRLVAWSDYLCPWCANAAARLATIESEFSEVRVEWRSFTLHQLLPTAGALEKSSVALKEYIGWWVYWMRGWIPGA